MAAPFLYLMLAAAPAPAANPDIIVTGRGLDRAAGEEALDVVVLDRQRLAGSASGRLEEILREVPGFQLFRRSDARSANPTSQGATLRALGGNASSRVLLILDGVPQTDPFGGWISWPAFDPERLGEARVTRGGGSGGAGPGALAGTIELSSAIPAGLRGIRARLAYGSRDSVDAHAGFGLALGEGFLSASAAFAQGDGFTPILAEDRGAVDRPAPYRQASLAVRGVGAVSSGTEVQGNLLAFSDARERGSAFSAIRTRGADASVRLVGRRWSALAYVQIRDFYNSFAAVGAGRASVNRTSEQYGVPSTGLGMRGELRPRLGRRATVRLGGDWRLTEGESRELFAFVAGTATRGRAAGGRSGTAGIFAEASWTGGPVTLTGGARLDRWTIADGRLQERVLAGGAVLTNSLFPDRDGWEPTGRAAFAWRRGEALTLRGAAYLGWRLPTLNELYRPFRVGPDATAANAALAPERLRGVELGVDWRPAAGAKLGATIFDNRLAGAIANVTLGHGPGTFPGVGFVTAGGEYRRRENLEAIAARGIEVDAGFEQGPWRLWAGASLVAAEVVAEGVAAPLNGLRPAQTPRLAASAGLDWAGDGRRASLAARYTGAQFEDDLNRQRLPAALSLDASASFPVGKSLALEARVENATGARILAGIASDGTRERATPRTLWLGLRFGLP
ncbi:MAG TPA: TonB-dependent receptor [Allosphingosinicella sp.]|nr:TonB-dependent receptor [Allosphingosinicella sp.]